MILGVQCLRTADCSCEHGDGVCVLPVGPYEKVMEKDSCSITGVVTLPKYFVIVRNEFAPVSIATSTVIHFRVLEPSGHLYRALSLFANKRPNMFTTRKPPDSLELFATEILPGPPSLLSLQQTVAKRDPKKPIPAFSYLPASDPGSSYSANMAGTSTLGALDIDGPRRKRARIDKG